MLLFVLVLIRLTDVRASVPSADSADVVWHAHSAIVSAIADHDPERAQRRMQRHLDAITPTLR